MARGDHGLLKVSPGSAMPYPTLRCPADGPPLKWPHGLFRGGLLAKQGTCDSFLPFWTPHAVREYKNLHQNAGLYVLFFLFLKFLVILLISNYSCADG
jgi:hypothetical protein